MLFIFSLIRSSLSHAAANFLKRFADGHEIDTPTSPLLDSIPFEYIHGRVRFRDPFLDGLILSR
jgi:hypothetical protein